MMLSFSLEKLFILLHNTQNVHLPAWPQALLDLHGVLVWQLDCYLCLWIRLAGDGHWPAILSLCWVSLL